MRDALLATNSKIPVPRHRRARRRLPSSPKVNVYSVALHSRDFASSNQVVRLERGTVQKGLWSHVFDFLWCLRKLSLF